MGNIAGNNLTVETGGSKPEYYQSKTGSMGNTHTETQTDETQGERARDEKVLLKI